MKDRMIPLGLAILICSVLLFIILGIDHLRPFLFKQDAELLQARADKQEAQWMAMELSDKVEESQGHYRDLLKEFGDYQSEHDCKAKK